MRLHRFYIEEINPIITDERLIHQWKNVFRYEAGDRVVLFDGSGKDFTCEIKSLNKKEATITIVEEKEGKRPTQNITLYQSLIKKDNFELIIEKTTELGVSKIVPVLSERSEKKGFNMERARKIAIEAAEQCGRADIPEIESSQYLVDSIKEIEGHSVAFDPSGSPFSYPTTHSLNLPTSIFIGPEGGFTEKELELFKAKGVAIHSLGSLILRAETAAIAALALSTLPDSSAS